MICKRLMIYRQVIIIDNRARYHMQNIIVIIAFIIALYYKHHTVRDEL